jgi:hypothetical protein
MCHSKPPLHEASPHLQAMMRRWTGEVLPRQQEGHLTSSFSRAPLPPLATLRCRLVRALRCSRSRCTARRSCVQRDTHARAWGVQPARARLHARTATVHRAMAETLPADVAALAQARTHATATHGHAARAYLCTHARTRAACLLTARFRSRRPLRCLRHPSVPLCAAGPCGELPPGCVADGRQRRGRAAAAPVRATPPPRCACHYDAR